MKPKSETIEKILCCLCCQSGPISIRAELQKQALHVGEPLSYSLEIDNRATAKPLRKIEAKVIQQVSFFSTSRKETQEFTISSDVLCEGIPPLGEGTWKDMKLNLRDDTVPNFECKCMLVEYYFVASVDIESAFDPKVIFLITIVNGVSTSKPGLKESENEITHADIIVVNQPPKVLL